MDWKSWAFFLLFFGLVLVSTTQGFDFFQSRSAPGGGFYRPRGGPGGGAGADNEEYYRILGIPKTSTIPEIKRAYRKLVVRMHPDKGGDEAKFKELQEAYECLSDPSKRRLYDAYGKAGVEMGGGGGGGGGGGMGPEDVFNSFFGGRPRGSSAGPRRSPNLFLQVELTLEELYKGATRKVRLNRQKVVDKRLVLEPKILEASFDKGMKDGARVVLAGEAEGLGNTAPGDIIIQVREIKHPTFVRRNADLLTEMKVTLTEALTGFERPLRHLDGRQLWVKGKPGQVARPGSVWILEGEGMPIQGEPSSHGRLFIKFSVEFPPSLASLTPEQVATLKKLLPKAPVFARANDAEDAPALKAGDPRSFGTVGASAPGGGSGSTGGFGYDADEEEEDDYGWGGGGYGAYGGMPRGEQVQCSQQ